MNSKMLNERSRTQGAELVDGGVHYRTWCEHPEVALLLVRQNGETIRRVELQPESDGYFAGQDRAGKAGDLYRYQFGESQGWPDPASRAQPFGVHGASQVVDPSSFSWTDSAWRKPALRDLIIYELHLGTFTTAGTFRSAIARFDYLVELGITAVELMPIADFPGERNWGYDGVAIYAPARAYGTPDDLRAFVNAAHARGLTVLLDVVYNHLGPDGNYVGCYHREYWNPGHQTPWGAGLNFEHPAVRNFFAENPGYWMREFHFDGFRLDATHAIQDDSEPHFLAEIAERIHSLGGIVVAEDERNEPKLLRARAAGGYGLDGCWADDFHHVTRVLLTDQREGYYQNYAGTTHELAQTISHGWLFRGQTQKTTGKPRGGDPTGLAAEQFIFCISNHDQVGNRAFGERLGHEVSPALYRAVSALLCLVPQTPMFFMGQEWNASTPFQFFTDHADELGRNVTAGRRREFRHFAAFCDPALLESIPDPQGESTFVNSKLRWDELHAEQPAQLIALHREFLQLRRKILPNEWSVSADENGNLIILFGPANGSRFAVTVALQDAVQPRRNKTWRQLLSTNEARFGGNDEDPSGSPATIAFEFAAEE